MANAILFDLGNTLVRYYNMPEFPGILDHCLHAAEQSLRDSGCAIDVAIDNASGFGARVAFENHEAKDYKVRPLEGRLSRIFELDRSADNTHAVADACVRFMEPIFTLGSVYGDVISNLSAIREMGVKTAIVTNTPWGSPSNLWREEITRLGLADMVDAIVCCRDVGWRKPAAPIFQRAMDMLDTTAADCVFVGDDPRWDIVGPQAIGMDAILIDRDGRQDHGNVTTIQSLDELVQRLANADTVGRK